MRCQVAPDVEAEPRPSRSTAQTRLASYPHDVVPSEERMGRGNSNPATTPECKMTRFRQEESTDKWLTA